MRVIKSVDAIDVEGDVVDRPVISMEQVCETSSTSPLDRIYPVADFLEQPMLIWNKRTKLIRQAINRFCSDGRSED